MEGSSGPILPVLVFLLASNSSASRILAFFPFIAVSHHHVYQPILYELAKRGHQVDYFSPVPIPHPHPNITVVDLEMKNYVGVLKKFVSKLCEKLAPFDQASLLNDFGYSLAQTSLANKQVRGLIDSKENYDAVLHEAFFVQEYAVAFAHKFKAPSVAIHPLGDYPWLNEISALTDNPAFMINCWMTSNSLSFFDRVEAFKSYWTSVAVGFLGLRRQQALVDEHFVYPGWESRPSLFELLPDQAVILTNSHHSFGYAYPKAPHVKEIGGVNVLPVKPLTPEFQKYMDDATEGVIYFSLGSNINQSEITSLSFREALSTYFGQIKQKVLWKYDGEPWPNLPSNIRLGKWFPQQGILAHKNLKVFITHGGLLSSFEAVSLAIPMIVIPFFGDQQKNAKLASTVGLGIELHVNNVTVESLAWATKEILENPRFKEEAVRRASLFHDRPMKPVEEAAYWVEYVIRHGRVLQPAGARLSFIELHLLDVYAFFAVVIAAIIWLTKRLVASIIRQLSWSRTAIMKKAVEKKKQ